MDYLIAFSSKRVKRVKGVRYIWIFWKIWILRFLDDFWPKSRFTLFGTLFFFCWGFKSIVFRTLCPANGFEIDLKAKKGHRFENFCHKIRTENVLLEVNFSKFHKMVLLQAGNAFFRTKNRVGKGNILLY